jgi:hypothetical protein
MEKHMGKVYEKKIIEGFDELLIRLKTKEKSQQITLVNLDLFFDNIRRN